MSLGVKHGPSCHALMLQLYMGINTEKERKKERKQTIYDIGA